MQRAYRLRKNKQFQYVYPKGRSCASREIVLLYIRASRLQVGFSVSRKVGNSVMRNRVKRRLREHMGHVDENMMNQVDNAIAVSFGLPQGLG